MGLLNTEQTGQGLVLRGVTETAKSVGCDPAHISRIMHKKARPSLVLARKLSQYFGITLEELCIHLDIGSSGELKG